MKLSPSKEMWDYYFKASWEKQNITPLGVCSAIADIWGGYHISYTAMEVLKDLGLVGKNGQPNKRAREAIATYLHHEFHKSTSPLEIVPPDTEKTNGY